MPFCNEFYSNISLSHTATYFMLELHNFALKQDINEDKKTKRYRSVSNWAGMYGEFQGYTNYKTYYKALTMNTGIFIVVQNYFRVY